MSEYEVGNTIRVWAEFTDWAPQGEEGEPIDPSSVEVFTYDAGKTLLSTAEATSEENEPGLYYYDWTLPDTPGTYYIEIKGMIDGKPQVSRAKVKAKWDV